MRYLALRLYNLKYLKMECISHKKEIANTYKSVSNLSFQEKKDSSFNENRINDFLDSILEFKAILTHKTESINSIILV